jgi:hypothetical protein
MKATHGALKTLAAMTWYAGGGALLLKGTSLVVEARSLQPGRPWPWLAVGVGLLAGAVKACCLFAGKCRKNLVRIDHLVEPKVWQFYRPSFFMFLALMIAFGASLSRMAHGNYVFLLCVAGLDLCIAAALLGSSYVFWKNKANRGISGD